MSPVMRGLLVAGIITAVLATLWLKYSDFLSRGQAVPESTRILNELEAEGVPDFTLKNVKGQPVSLKDFRGKLVLLNFWASWCEPCIQEFPSMLKLIDTMKGDVQLLAVSADYEEKDIEPFLKAFKVENPSIHIMWDRDQTVARSFGTFKLPESYIIDRNGRLIRKIAGVEDWATEDAKAFFNQLISQAEKNEL
jgi:thiol-disulfide isomerase/thioredoxin